MRWNQPEDLLEDNMKGCIIYDNYLDFNLKI